MFGHRSAPEPRERERERQVAVKEKKEGGKEGMGVGCLLVSWRSACE